jgi:hypothetical protein
MPYTSINSQGGLLPLDLLDRVGAGQASRQGPTDFGLPSGARLTDRIQSAYSDARMYWDVYQRRLKTSSESRTTLTRQAWIVPLLELLGFEHLKAHRAALQIGEDSFTISHTHGDFADYVPVHIVGNDLSVDKRASRRRSPHSTVQEYLNRSDSVWGLVTNGDHLRLLRSTSRSAIPTYVEFDLAGIMESNQYTEFVLLYRLLHASRFPATEGSWGDSIIEYYYEQGVNEGDRVRDRLREGVEQALKILGTGLIKHPDSETLREQLRSGRLSQNQFYQQLLRTVYRLLFLMVAEERRLISVPSATDVQRQIYSRYYSVSHIRDRSEIYFAEDRSSDLWQSLSSTFRILADGDKAASIGIAPLGTQLFGFAACENVEAASCGNYPVLAAIRNLSMFQTDIGPRRVNYAGLDVEELGSVYESLLDYQPNVDLETRIFDLRAGSDRRTTGSFYTPPNLVAELIENTLVPAIQEKLKAAGDSSNSRQQALLDLRVLDPASGSGHFLLAAARRIGHELAKIRSDEEEPSPSERRHAVRDVIRESIYAVDKNPLAVDLCKLAMWLESHDSTRPLGFLDHHIMCGDSLIGVSDLAVLQGGIPDEAFKFFDDDDRALSRSLRDRNRVERGHVSLGEKTLEGTSSDLANQFAELGRFEENTPQDVQAKADLYSGLAQGDSAYDLARACDLWVYGFFASKKKSRQEERGAIVPTTSSVRTAIANPTAGDQLLIGEATSSALNTRAFHWALEFPDVIGRGGFDVILGNPPFLVGDKITSVFGGRYRNYIDTEFDPFIRRADLCVAVLRRAYSLLRIQGSIGIVSTNTISQGDSRQSGLKVLTDDQGVITFGRKFIPWPGQAGVEVNLLTISKGMTNRNKILDGSTVDQISSRLDTQPEIEPKILAQSKNRVFEGDKPRGKGFLVNTEWAKNLLSEDPKNNECLLPYLTGSDINGDITHKASRYAICFRDWDLQRARKYPELIKILETQVKPERAKLTKANDKYARETWWRFFNYRRELRTATSEMDQVLVRSRVSELHMVARVHTGQIFSDAVTVFAFDDLYHFSLLQSGVHDAWVRLNSSTMRTDVRYTPTTCFATFAFPGNPSKEHIDEALDVGRRYEQHRASTMQKRQLGMTKVYNMFNSQETHDHDIELLRALQAEMDLTILNCYGWADVDLGHDFHKTERGQTRFTISSKANREIVRRLMDLNAEITSKED